jgi:hypothetical protein
MCYSGVSVQDFNLECIISGTLNHIKKIEKSEKIFQRKKSEFQYSFQ